MTAGKTYNFKVEARNSFGYSEASQAVAILCATVPSTPAAPSNYVDGPNVNIKWTKPKINGLEITAYTVTIQTSTGSFLTELAFCDGAKPNVVAATQCEIPLTTLITAPFNLARGDSVNVKVLATNAYGSSS